MTRRALVFALLALLPAISVAQQGATSPIDGVWRITEETTTGANATSNKSPQPSLLIFARGHYSWISLGGTTARKQRPAVATPGKPTDAEKIAAYEEWGPVTANAGTFEVKGSTLSRRLLVAKNVGPMTAKDPTLHEFKIEGDTLWLVQKTQSGETRTRLTRVR